MSDLKPYNSSLEIYKKSNATYYISKTLQNQRRQILQILPVGPVNYFCNGRCSEATRFDDLCQACLEEYYDFERSRL